MLGVVILSLHQKPLAAPPKVMGALPPDAAQRPRSAANGNLNGGGNNIHIKRTASPQQPSPQPRRVTAGPLPSGGGGACPAQSGPLEHIPRT